MKHRRPPEPLYPPSELMGIEAYPDSDGTGIQPQDQKFIETTRVRVRRESGPPFVIRDHRRRFVVFAVSGYAIGEGGASMRLGKTWSVLDSDDEFHEVARFLPWGGRNAEALARAKADALNAAGRAA